MLGARVVGMAVGQSLVGNPHNLLKLEELGYKAREAIVDFLRILRDYRVQSALKQSNKKS
jgi:hypothetical protein